MKNIIKIFFFVLTAWAINASQSCAQMNIDSQKKLYLMSPAEIDEFLPRLHEAYPKFDDRIRALCYLRLDTPYDIKALGDGAGIEPNPVFRIDMTNCTVQILTNVALANAYSYAQAESLMAYINYYPVPEGENPIFYENRRHYTSDRLITSDYFENITTKIATIDELDTVKITLNRKSDGSRFLPVDWEKYVEYPFISRDNLTKAVLKKLPPVTGVGIVRKSLFKLGIIIAHEGIVLDGKDFVHASSSANKVVQEDFYNYTHRKTKNNKYLCDGVVFYLMKEVK